MGRKVALTAAAVLVVVLSVVLVGGQVGRGRFFEKGNHEPIYIFGNNGFTQENGVICGTGTATDPFVIEGWQIDAPQADYGIYVDHTTACFVIRDCSIERARLAGVYFNTVSNGLLERSHVALSDTAVYLLNSSWNGFRDNVVADSRCGIVMGARAMGNVVSGNAFLNVGQSGYDPFGKNRWYDACRGNYWSDYEGEDRDGDGIGDVPYYRVFDPLPLVVLPGAPCEAATTPVRAPCDSPAVPVVMSPVESVPMSVEAPVKEAPASEDVSPPPPPIPVSVPELVTPPVLPEPVDVQPAPAPEPTPTPAPEPVVEPTPQTEPITEPESETPAAVETPAEPTTESEPEQPVAEEPVVDGDADTESVQTESETAPAAEPATSEPDAAADEGQF